MREIYWQPVGMCFCEIWGEGNRARKVFSGRHACYQCWNLRLLASAVTYERRRAGIVRQGVRNTDTKQWGRQLGMSGRDVVSVSGVPTASCPPGGPTDSSPHGANPRDVRLTTCTYNGADVKNLHPHAKTNIQAVFFYARTLAWILFKYPVRTAQ